MSAMDENKTEKAPEMTATDESKTAEVAQGEKKKAKKRSATDESKVEQAPEEARGEEKKAKKQGGSSFKRSTYAGVGSWTPQTLVAYVPNGKKAGTKSAERYNVYAEAKTVDEALSLGSLVPDLLNDFEKGLLKAVGGVTREPGVAVSGAELASMNKLDRILYNFGRRACGEARAVPKASEGGARRKVPKGKSQKEKLKPQGLRSFFLKGKAGEDRPEKGESRTRKEQKERLQRRLLKRAQHRAKMLKYGLDPEAKMPEMVSGENSEIQHGRLLADAAAGEILARAEADGGKITDEDVVRVFRQWAFKKNDVRQNVIPEGQEWVFSDTLGLLRDRCGQYIMTGPTKAYPRVMRLVNRWVKDCWGGQGFERDFPFTSISVNSGYAAKLHRDGNNHGPSICKAIGDFTGGRLGYFAEDDGTMELDTLKTDHEQESVWCEVKEGFQGFDGNRGHWVEPYTGERMSFVFFTVGKYWKTKADVVAALKDRGFDFPTPESMAHAESLLAQPRGYGANQLPKMASLASMFGQAPLRPQVVKRAWEVPKESAPKKSDEEPNVLASLLAAKSAPAEEEEGKAQPRTPPPAEEQDKPAAPATGQKPKRAKTARSVAQAEAQGEPEKESRAPRPIASPAAAPLPEPATREALLASLAGAGSLASPSFMPGLFAGAAGLRLLGLVLESPRPMELNVTLTNFFRVLLRSADDAEAALTSCVEFLLVSDDLRRGAAGALEETAAAKAGTFAQQSSAEERLFAVRQAVKNASIDKTAVLQALAFASVLTLPPSPWLPAMDRPWGTAEERHAELVAMEREVRSAHAETRSVPALVRAVLANHDSRAFAAVARALC